jgi:2-polyprenyl-3-methyl-5-hydroxy-6-metoxy-1,4-benzoquinol methylase
MDTDAVTDGQYYREQIGSKSRIIAWSHRSRFNTVNRLIGSSKPRLLDYGCGDGTLLALASGSIAEGTGVDADAGQIDECRTRLASFGNLQFLVVSDVAGENHDSAYDVVTCMETLEHCTEAVVEVVLADLARLCAPDGRVIISVPIEVGPSFLLKQSIRAIAKRRGLSSYHLSERYSTRDALKMIFASRGTSIERREYVFDESGEVQGYSHYGFNWRGLREGVTQYMRVERTLFSPVGFLGGWVSSQVYFVCRPQP